MSMRSESQPVFGDIDVPEPLYQETETTAFYLGMRDGVRIAVDLVLPSPLPAQEKIPALLTQTRYWRAMELRPIFSEPLVSSPRQPPMKSGSTACSMPAPVESCWIEAL